MAYIVSMANPNELTSMTVSLPATQKEYVKAQAVASGCSTPSEYIRRLIHSDQRAREREDFERRILEGLESPARELSSEDWLVLRASLRQRLADRKQA